eukprot:NODE_7724_length_424_cov_214.452575.p1 GENE.NODE_7724_length_424_cov_214.452575~~NODE_7724_length_424_cov_214.452575.p1  ORF type:complete len:95 (-),score=15.75 NODE_7724_length_424_cov_214.452575:37-321(-)
MEKAEATAEATAEASVTEEATAKVSAKDTAEVAPVDVVTANRASSPKYYKPSRLRRSTTCSATRCGTSWRRRRVPRRMLTCLCSSVLIDVSSAL